MSFVDIIGYVTGVIGALGSSIFYLKYVATKANIAGKNETIDTLERSNSAYKDENVSLLAKVESLEGQNKALQAIVTNTPEIIKLTRSVTALTESVASQHRETTLQNTNIANILTELLTVVKKGYDKPEGVNNERQPKNIIA